MEDSILKEKRKEFEKLKRTLILEKRCCNCESIDNIHFHHVVPLYLGGTNNPKNIVPLCNECHSKVHGMEILSENEILKKRRIDKIKEANSITFQLINNDTQECKLVLGYDDLKKDIKIICSNENVRPTQKNSIGSRNYYINRFKNEGNQIDLFKNGKYTLIRQKHGSKTFYNNNLKGKKANISFVLINTETEEFTDIKGYNELIKVGKNICKAEKVKLTQKKSTGDRHYYYKRFKNEGNQIDLLNNGKYLIEKIETNL